MTLIDILTIVGSIGLFLYGMTLMSEGLQKIAGDSFRDFLASITKNRVTGMLTGIVVTVLLQSSSATTVMMVSYVNAGLITLAQSMAGIMGANVGTTATVWLIALLGFKFSITPYLFPLLALALPLFQSVHSRRNSWGEFIIGFTLLFISIDAMRGAMPSLSDYPALVSDIMLYCHQGIIPVMLMWLTGILLTMLVQSSSISVTLAMLLCSGNWLSLTSGCALVLGANIGTCIMPLIASRRANTMAKRAAMGHLLFNVGGSIWALALLNPICNDLLPHVCDYLGITYPRNILNPDYPLQAALCLCLFHTLFNSINLCLFLPLTQQFVRLVTRLIPHKDEEAEDFKLQYISSGLISSGELALVQVLKETSRYCEDTYKMFGLVRQMLAEPLGSDRQQKLHQQIGRMEEESDRAEMEIANFLNQISPKTLSWQGEQLSRNLYKIVDELESIADSIYHISATLHTKSEQLVRFSPELNANLNKMFDLTDAALTHMLKLMAMDEIPPHALNKAYNYEDEINNFRNQFRNAVLDQFDRQEVEYLQSTFFMMMINECEKIGDYVINVVTAASEK